jgi:hypothetical protein
MTGSKKKIFMLMPLVTVASHRHILLLRVGALHAYRMGKEATKRLS